MKIVMLDTICQTAIGGYLKQSLEALAHEVHLVDMLHLTKSPPVKLQRTLAQIKRQKNINPKNFVVPSGLDKPLLKILRSIQPQYVIVLGSLLPLLNPVFISQIRKQFSIPVVLWDTVGLSYMIDPVRFHYFLTAELARYDHVFTYSKNMSLHYINLGLESVSWLPYAAKAQSFIPQVSVRAHDVCCLALPDVRSRFLLEWLHDYDLQIYGHQWEQHAASLSPKLQQKLTYTTLLHDEQLPLFKANHIILNISNVAAASIASGVELQVFNALAMGGFVLTNHCQELSELFEVGVHLDSFQTSEEMKSKVNFYLKNPVLRKQVATEGQDYILQQHTWMHRAKTLMTYAQINRKVTDENTAGYTR